MSLFDLHRRKVLVPGGAQGLGTGMARALAAAVMIADAQEDAARAAAQAISDTGASAEFVKLDVTDDANWEAAITETVARLGGLDGVVNNAGLEITEFVADLKPASIRKMPDVNVLGTSPGGKHAFRAMHPGVRRARAARW